MHKIVYDNASSSWNEALPLGNGNYGTMVFYEYNKLTMAMNHYEVYYKKLSMYSQKFKNSDMPDYHKVFGKTFEEVRRSGLEKYCDPNEKPFRPYQDSTGQNPEIPPYGRAPGAGVSHYPTGEIVVIPDSIFAEPDNYFLELDIDKAKVKFEAQKAEDKLSVSNFIAQGKDFMVTKISQNKVGLAHKVQMYVPQRRGQQMQVDYRVLNETTFYYIGSFYPDGEAREKYEPFKFVVILKVIGAKGNATITENGLDILLHEATNEVMLITTVVTEEECKNILEMAKKRLEYGVESFDHICKNHEKYWEDFWAKSAISLPDKMLEDLWYVNLYALASSSGSGGRMYHQACGLNGLWDIKQPTRWGSMWYWDVNIQAAFSPVYTANHLEIAKVFNDAFLSYTKRAEKMAKDYHGIDGYAADFPFANYLCIWPWCAQYLWWYYRYSMDLDFLREKAYPVFKKIICFFEGYMKFDDKEGKYYIYPDVSPEQGPLTRNSTSTVSTVKNLLKISIEASNLLSVDDEERQKWIYILSKMPDYPIVKSNNYGEIVKDSEWAPTELHLRHPSLLMPIYPMNEISKYSDEGLKAIAENTLRYAIENTEIGVFQFGWLSRAAARLGKGDTALRMIYERGIDLLLRPNGLFSEETERWINFCNVTTPAIYHPHMMEATGEMVSAVNEMLLQSHNGFIEVFPAMPDKKDSSELDIGVKKYESKKKMESFKKWDNCSFKGLLAEGAFEVSATRVDGVTTSVKIKSLSGSKVKIKNPFLSNKEIKDSETLSIVKLRCINETKTEYVSFLLEGDFILFNTVEGNEYLLCSDCHKDEEKQGVVEVNIINKNPIESNIKVKIHKAHTNRRVYLGKNKDTHYVKMLDKFTFDYYSGNYRESQTSIYRFDFGTRKDKLAKDYRNILAPQVHLGGNMGQDFIRVTINSVFSEYKGWGWDNENNASYVDRGEPDEFRRDFICGTDKKAFFIELPKGRYDFLFVSGDSQAPSYTEIAIEGQCSYKKGELLKAGEFVTDILPVVQKKDGYLKVEFSSLEDYKWAINLIIINKYYTFL